MNHEVNTAAHIHPQACVETNIGHGTRVWAWAHIMDGAQVGANCNIGEHCFIENGAVVGDNCIIKNGVQIWNHIIIENGVFVAAGTIFTNERYTRSGFPKQLEETHIKEGVTIGAGSIILCGLTIGRYATIGAGSLVVRNVKPYALVYGRPAEWHGDWMCVCGEKLSQGEKDYQYICACGREYQEDREQLTLMTGVEK